MIADRDTIKVHEIAKRYTQCTVHVTHLQIHFIFPLFFKHSHPDCQLVRQTDIGPFKVSSFRAGGRLRRLQAAKHRLACAPYIQVYHSHSHSKDRQKERQIDGTARMDLATDQLKSGL